MLKKILALMTFLSGLCWTEATNAQYKQLPTNLGAARMPEPIPIDRIKKLPPLKPGPISPIDAPPGPSEDLSLPGNHTSAFQCEDHCYDNFVYFHAGVLSLQRQRLGNMPIVFGNSANPGLDTGVPPSPQNTVLLQDLNDLTTTHQLGGTATLGFLFDICSLEFSGFYLGQNSDSIEATGLGQVSTFFINPPVGFVGNNGLFLEADRIRTELKTNVGGAEINLRYTNSAFKHIEPIYGIRYFHFRDHFQIFADDDSLSFSQFPVNPRLQATYSSIAENNFVGPQLGAEYQQAILPGLVLGAYGKVALGANIANVRFRLRRGDGFPGLLGNGRSAVIFSQVYEGGFNLDAYALERFRIRVGYHVVFASQFVEGADQVDFDLSNSQGRVDNTGNVFFHGPRVEFQFLF